MSVCLDASIWVKLWLDEPNTDRARALLDRIKQQRWSIWAPAHSRLEISNVFFQRWRRNELTHEECLELVRQVNQLPLRIDNNPARLEEAMQLAVEWNLPSLFDALYCSVSKAHQSVLWTADQTLHRLASKHVEWVKLLSDNSV